MVFEQQARWRINENLRHRLVNTWAMWGSLPSEGQSQPTSDPTNCPLYTEKTKQFLMHKNLVSLFQEKAPRNTVICLSRYCLEGSWRQQVSLPLRKGNINTWGQRFVLKPFSLTAVFLLPPWKRSNLVTKFSLATVHEIRTWSSEGESLDFIQRKIIDAKAKTWNLRKQKKYK